MRKKDKTPIIKAIRMLGIASRNEAVSLIKAGKVRVNGRVVNEFYKVQEGDVIEVGIEKFEWKNPDKVYLILNKPAGFSSQKGEEPTVYSLVPHIKGLFAVGRLDRNTEGLLLFTNDGDIGNRMLNPKNSIERKYLVGVEGEVSLAKLNALKKGFWKVIEKNKRDKVIKEKVLFKAKEVRFLYFDGKLSWIELVLTTGKKREVRELMKAVGYKVRKLVRISFGPLTLGDLEIGSWRYLTDEEVKKLKEALGLKDGNFPNSV